MDEIEKSMKQIRRGDIIEGSIISVNDSEILVNVGGSSDGIVTLEELDEDTINPLDIYSEGEKITVMVVKVDDGEGNIILSKKRAEYAQVWKEFEISRDGDLTFKVKVKEVVKGGVIALIKGVRGFIPASQLSIRYVENLEEYVGETLEVKAIDFDEEKQKVVLSAKAVEAKVRERKSKVLFDSLSEGQVFQGEVTRLANFGAFVDLGGSDGLIHISELSWKRIKHPSEVVKVGDIVEVSVLKVDKASKKISLRLNDVQDNPWDNIYNYYQEDDVAKGVVVRLATFGAFVELETGIDGLVHVSEISEERISKPADVLSVGQEVEVMIIGIDSENKKMSLSIKALNEEPEIDVADYLEKDTNETTIGSLFKDKLKNLKL